MAEKPAGCRTAHLHHVHTLFLLKKKIAHQSILDRMPLDPYQRTGVWAAVYEDRAPAHFHEQKPTFPPTCARFRCPPLRAVAEAEGRRSTASSEAGVSDALPTHSILWFTHATLLTRMAPILTRSTASEQQSLKNVHLPNFTSKS